MSLPDGARRYKIKPLFLSDVASTLWINRHRPRSAPPFPPRPPAWRPRGKLQLPAGPGAVPFLGRPTSERGEGGESPPPSYCPPLVKRERAVPCVRRPPPRRPLEEPWGKAASAGAVAAAGRGWRAPTWAAASRAPSGTASPARRRGEGNGHPGPFRSPRSAAPSARSRGRPRRCGAEERPRMRAGGAGPGGGHLSFCSPGVDARLDNGEEGSRWRWSRSSRRLGNRRARRGSQLGWAVIPL